MQHARGKTEEGIDFTKSSTSINYLINNFYFNIENVRIKQAIGIPMEIDFASFLANLFLYSYKEESMSFLISSDKIKARHFFKTKCLFSIFTL